MAELYGAREAAIAKELTKLHESVARGTLPELVAAVEQGDELKGEFVVLVGPPRPEEAAIGDDAIVASLKQSLEHESFRDAVRSVAERFGLKRSRVYELGLALNRGGAKAVREKRVRAYRHGLFAETLAALLLRLKGHRILARRYKTPVGEIDLMALKGKRLAFVEVKQRNRFEDAGWSLPTRSRRRIVRAAQYWLAGHPDFAGHDIAFDVVLAAPWGWPQYIANAFPV